MSDARHVLKFLLLWNYACEHQSNKIIEIEIWIVLCNKSKLEEMSGSIFSIKSISFWFDDLMKQWLKYGISFNSGRSQTNVESVQGW